MPCRGPSEEELRQDERAANKRKFGKSWTNDEWAENTACAYTAQARHKTPLPSWAVLWSDEHEERDKQRKQAFINQKEAEHEDDLAQLKRLQKKLGVK